MMNSTATIIAAIFSGLFGYFGVQYIAGATVFSAQAGTLGGIFAMGLFFGTMWIFRSIADGQDIRTKMRTIQRKKNDSVAARQIQAQSTRLANMAKFTQAILFLKPETHLPQTRERLLRAGYFTDEALFTFVIIQTGFVLTGLLLFALLALLGAKLSVASAIGLFISAIGWYGPSSVLNSIAKKRRIKLFIEFPDALDLIIIYVESGSSFDNAVTKVIDTLMLRYPTVASELKILEYELRYYTDRFHAFDNMERRCNIDLVSRFVSIVQQSEQIGSPIAEALKVLAKDSRDERFLDAERRVEKLPVLLTVPMVLFIFPSLFLIIMGPVVIQLAGIFAKLIK